MIIAPIRKNIAAMNAQINMLIGDTMPSNSIITARTSIIMPTVFIPLFPSQNDYHRFIDVLFLIPFHTSFQPG